MNLRKIHLLSLCLLTAILVCGQASTSDKATATLQKLSATYKEARYLSFDVKYLCKEEDRPKHILDSLSGSFKIDGDKFWYSLDNTEAICGDDYSLVLFREDKLMYLSKSSQAASALNPVASIDSFLSRQQGSSISLSEVKDGTAVTLNFPEGHSYKSLSFYIDQKTGFVTKTVSVVKMALLYGPGVSASEFEKESFGMVEAIYTNYKAHAFDASVFDFGKYYQKKGQDFIAVPPFSEYKILLGSTNL